MLCNLPNKKEQTIIIRMVTTGILQRKRCDSGNLKEITIAATSL